MVATSFRHGKDPWVGCRNCGGITRFSRQREQTHSPTGMTGNAWKPKFSWAGTDTILVVLHRHAEWGKFRVTAQDRNRSAFNLRLNSGHLNLVCYLCVIPKCSRHKVQYRSRVPSPRSELEPKSVRDHSGGIVCRSSQQWLDKNGVEPVKRQQFDAFLKANPTAANMQSDADKETLFQQFHAWAAAMNAQARDSSEEDTKKVRDRDHASRSTHVRHSPRRSHSAKRMRSEQAVMSDECRRDPEACQRVSEDARWHP